MMPQDDDDCSSSTSQVEHGIAVMEEEASCSVTNKKSGDTILMSTEAAPPQDQQDKPLERRNVCRKLAVSLVLLLAIGSIFAIVMEVILPQEGQWSDLTSHRCTEFCENSHQCDHTMEDRPTVQQPANAYTNLAYIWCGLVPLVFIRLDLSTFMYFCASTLLAIGSFMFHASISSYWAALDVSFMCTYGMALIFHGFYVVFRVPWKFLSLVLVALFITIPIIKPRMKMDIQLFMMGMFVVVVILVAILVMARIYMILARQPKKLASDSGCKTCCSKTWQILVIISVAFVPAILSGVATFVWSKDLSKEWCNPDSAWQWHGVWHVLTAFASLWTWMFFDRNRLKAILATSYPPTINLEESNDSTTLTCSSA